VVPVAHNGGRVWPKNSFLKYPGRVTVRIGPAIETAGRDPEAINAEAEAWIEAQQRILDH
jgi:1-acyl-sn-glycerol-3-phosphate acyltransferase